MMQFWHNWRPNISTEVTVENCFANKTNIFEPWIFISIWQTGNGNPNLKKKKKEDTEPTLNLAITQAFPSQLKIKRPFWT